MALNILVVDDSAVMRSIVIKTLKMTGLPLGEIWEGSNGEEGLKILQEKWIDLALVDIHMPVMDGEEMINHLRENEQYQNLPVIVVSSESDPSKIEMMHRKGATFIHKPFKPETLKEVMIAVTGVSNEYTD
ncbi:MAG TPA: response regulator [Smithella sp.]|nr:response regulator [Smithella sp.]MDM7987402.1 response regulator [Smithella sp.]HNY49405.1 response regulator [Smithella sp.]HOG89404.1 response regulator [Smithella sp.]HOU51521.1 response regulator [Smithella sp.]